MSATDRIQCVLVKNDASLLKTLDNAHFLVVTNDDITHKLKGKTVWNESERYESVMHCRYVDEVLTDAPWVITPEFMEEHQVRRMFQDYMWGHAFPRSTLWLMMSFLIILEEVRMYTNSLKRWVGLYPHRELKEYQLLISLHGLYEIMICTWGGILPEAILPKS